MFMRFRWAVSFESDSAPVTTVRGEFDRDDFESANKSAMFLASKQTKWQNRYRSCVVVVEMLAEDGKAVA
jgi:hypothetical protein